MIRQWLRRMKRRLIRNLQPIDWGTFESVKPVSSVFGFDRGQPVDRYYIENFLFAKKADIQKVVLEIGDNSYTKQYGGNRVAQSEVLHAVMGNPNATLVGDLATGAGIPASYFDCLILTQTLLCIFDIHSAIKHCYEALKPNGVLLITVPGISQISRYDMDRWGDYWRFTDLSIIKLLSEHFEEQDVQVCTYGNVKTAVAHLQGVSVEDMTKSDLDYIDRNYQVVIGARAVKKGS